MDNIAEGFGRSGTKEFRQALAQAKGSVHEVKSQVYTAFDRDHISVADRKKLVGLVEITEKLIGGFIRYLNRCDLTGTKFKEQEAFTDVNAETDYVVSAAANSRR